MAEHPLETVNKAHVPATAPTGPPSDLPVVSDVVLLQVVKLRTLAAYLTARQPHPDLNGE